MGEKRSMDYVYSDGSQEVIIEINQQGVRDEVIKQYVQCRKSKGMTQEALAKRAGIPRPNITRFESGSYNPSLEMMVRIAAALDMKLQVQLEEK